MAPAETFNFSVNEKALVYDGSNIYECKILKTELYDETNTPTQYLGPHYFVHYMGWKAT